jgi:hypothetical protein
MTRCSSASFTPGSCARRRQGLHQLSSGTPDSASFALKLTVELEKIKHGIFVRDQGLLE